MIKTVKVPISVLIMIEFFQLLRETESYAHISGSGWGEIDYTAGPDRCCKRFDSWEQGVSKLKIIQQEQETGNKKMTEVE